jgi:hypothetical protein
VLFVSDHAVIDGWDLPNVRVRHATPESWPGLTLDGDVVVPLSARWTRERDWSLSRTLPIAAEAIGAAHVVPVHDRPDAIGTWRAKGNRWHRPDMPVDGPGDELSELPDPHGCGLVFQRQLPVSGTIMTIGRFGAGLAAFGLFRIFEERFFRDVILQAVESIADAPLAARSIAAATALGVDGFCTMNWVMTDDGIRLTSARPIPRAVFGTFRRGGIDLLAPSSGTSMLPAGLRLNAQPHYASYQALEA